MKITDYETKYEITHGRVAKWLSNMNFHPEYPSELVIQAINDGLDTMDKSQFNHDLPGVVGGMVLVIAEKICPNHLKGLTYGNIQDTKTWDVETNKFVPFADKFALQYQSGRYHNGVLNTRPV